MGAVTNQDKGVTSTTSGGQGQTMGATDVCLDPSKTKSAGFENQAPNGNATTHSTPKTQVQGGPVIRQGDKVGPTSNPAHRNTGGGVTGPDNPYRQEAVGQSGSPNVRVEGKPPNRLTDPTTQNRQNAPGQFQQAAPGGQTPPAQTTPKEACHIEEVVIECKHGRKHGPDKILEVLGVGAQDTGPAGAVADKVAGVSGGARLFDEITLTSKRIDARTKGSPTCEPKTHTKWRLERSMGLRSPAKLLEVPSKDKHIIVGDWLNYGGELTYLGSAQNTPDTNRALKQSFLDDMLAQKNADRQARGLKPVGMKKLGNSYRTNANEMVRKERQAVNDLNKAMQKTTKLVSFGTLVEILFARLHAPTIAVKAEACSGAQDFKVRLLPPIKAEAMLTAATPEIRKLKSMLSALEKFMKVFKRLASMAGLSVDVGVVICEGGGVHFSAFWEEMTKDVPDLKLYKHHCDIDVEVAFGFAKLIGIKFNVGVPFVAFANVFIPGAGTAVASALNWLGATATIGVDVDFSLAPMFKIVKPAGQTGDWDVDLDMTLRVFFNVKIAWGTSVEVAGGVLVIGDPTLDNLSPFWPVPQIALNFKGGEIKVGFQGTAKVDVLWWEVNETIAYFPESCQVRYPGFAVKPLAWMSSNT